MLSEQLSRWVEAGLISEDQASRIRRHEFERAKPDERRTPLIVEALGYIGGALAVIAVIILAQEFWADLELWGKLALLGMVSLGLLIAGWVLRDSELEAVRRLAGFLWLFSAVGTAFTFGILSADGFDAQGETAAFFGALSAGVLALVLWRLRTESLQQLAFFAAAVVAGVFAVATFGWPDELFGLVVWGAGIAWLFLTWGTVIRPEITGYALGAASSLIGMQILTGVAGGGWPALLGVVVAGALIAASVAIRQIALLGIGAVGVFVFVPQVVFHYFGDSLGAPVALLVSGAVLIAGAIALSKLMGEIREDLAENQIQEEVES